jgi:hypothetical protein
MAIAVRSLRTWSSADSFSSTTWIVLSCGLQKVVPPPGGKRLIHGYELRIVTTVQARAVYPGLVGDTSIVNCSLAGRT